LAEFHYIYVIDVNGKQEIVLWSCQGETIYSNTIARKKKSKPRIYEIESANYGGELLEL